MKCVIIIPDGCSDEPQSALNGLTPLAAAKTPAMDRIALQGIVGRANHVPDGFTSGSAVANMSLLGYSPNKFFTGRAPIEAAAQGVEIATGQVAIRCNLVSIIDGVMTSFTAEQIPSDDARILLDDLQLALGDQAKVIPGVSYRNLMLCNADGDQFADLVAHPPHDVTDKVVTPYLPVGGSGAALLRQWMNVSEKVFRDHVVNQKRVAEGKLPATQVWLWGLGRRPELNSFQSQFGKNGAMITAVDLLRGLAKLIGWSIVNVPGATGYLDTNYANKGKYAISSLQQHDIVVVHVEATDEASHEGNLSAKIEALEAIDEKIVGPVLDHLENSDSPRRIMVTPDHPTFLRTKTHSLGHVPFSMCGWNVVADRFEHYHEQNSQRSVVCFDQGDELMPCFLNPEFHFSSEFENAS